MGLEIRTLDGMLAQIEAVDRDAVVALAREFYDVGTLVGGVHRPRAGTVPGDRGRLPVVGSRVIGVVVLGALGRMGSLLCATIAAPGRPDPRGARRPRDPRPRAPRRPAGGPGSSAAPLYATLGDALAAVRPDVAVDFTVPARRLRQRRRARSTPACRRWSAPPASPTTRSIDSPLWRPSTTRPCSSCRTSPWAPCCSCSSPRRPRATSRRPRSSSCTSRTSSTRLRARRCAPRDS